MENYLTLLETLSSVPGPPGGEESVAQLMRGYLAGSCRLERDRLGSLIGVREGAAAKPRVMVAAHMDEVGFMVQNITSKGVLRLQSLGGWIASRLPGQRLHVLGARGVVEGVVAAAPPHFSKDNAKEIQVEDLLLDVGAASREEVAGLGISLGDLVTPASRFSVLNERFLVNKAWDDRAGCAALIAAVTSLTGHPNTVIAAATVQEEVGARGAEAAIALIKPDLAVVLEGAPADDLPESGRDEPQGVLGKGCQIRLYDPSIIVHRRFWQWVHALAQEQGIACQLAVRRGGSTDARVIHLAQGGIPTVVLAVPVRYAHSHNSLMQIDDFLATVALTRLVLERLDEEVFNSFLPS